MSYFQARSDFRFLNEFRHNVFELWNLETAARARVRGYERWQPFSGYQAEVQSKAHELFDPEYSIARSKVAREIDRAIRISDRLRVRAIMTQYPAPTVGGPVIKMDVLSAILQDDSFDGIGRQTIADSLERVLGAAEARVDRELWRLVNPLYWIKELLVLLLRLPFLVFESAGFNTDKIEDHLVGKAFKIGELALILYLLTKWGMSKDQIVSLIGSLLSK